MNLAVKLYITNSEQTSLLCHYIFNLARYDQNYDIRDKARLLKQFIPQQEGKITSQSTRIFLASKPAPLLQSQFKDHEDLQLGSLSHYIKQRASGYEPLPPFPDHPPPNDVRNVEPIVAPEDSKLYKKSVLITKLVAPQHGNVFDNNISGQKGQRHVFVGVWKFTRP
jgi:AP-3 complex subunit beta